MNTNTQYQNDVKTELTAIMNFGKAVIYKEEREFNPKNFSFRLSKTDLIQEIKDAFPGCNVGDLNPDKYEFVLEVLELVENKILIRDVLYRTPLFLLTIGDKAIELEIFVYPERGDFYNGEFPRTYDNGENECHHFYYEILDELHTQLIMEHW